MTVSICFRQLSQVTQAVTWLSSKRNIQLGTVACSPTAALWLASLVTSLIIGSWHCSNYRYGWTTLYVSSYIFSLLFLVGLILKHYLGYEKGRCYSWNSPYLFDITACIKQKFTKSEDPLVHDPQVATANQEAAGPSTPPLQCAMHAQIPQPPIWPTAFNGPPPPWMYGHHAYPYPPVPVMNPPSHDPMWGTPPILTYTNSPSTISNTADQPTPTLHPRPSTTTPRNTST